MAAREASSDDLKLFTNLVSSLRSSANDVLAKTVDFLERSDGAADCNQKGLSFLTVKCNLLLSYVIDVAHLALRKCNGASISGSDGVARLIEIRTYLEKMKPIDHKLKYQVDKLIKIAATGGVGASDALMLKANPNNMASKLGDESDDSHSEAETKLYKPPKMTTAYFAENSVQDRANAAIDRAKKRALSSSIMQDLRSEYNDGPEEIVDAAHVVRGDRELARKRKYEENNFVRLTVSKAERQRLKRMHSDAALGSLTRFEDISALTGGDVADRGFPMKKHPSRKDRTKKKGGKASKYKRRK